MRASELLPLKRTLIFALLAAILVLPGIARADSPAAAEAVVLASDESGLANAINATRADHGLAPLVVDQELTAVARYRSADQVSRHYFSHTTPDGTTIFTVLDDAAVPWTAAGENLAESRGEDPVQAAINGFLQSPSHRANLLNSAYSHVGIGAAMDSDGTTILTVVFTD